MPKQLGQEVGLETVHGELSHTDAKLAAHSATKALHSRVSDSVAMCAALLVQELTLRSAVVSAQAREEFADEELDVFVDTIDAAINGLEKSGRDAVRTLFFQGKAPSVLKRPILGKQLDHMRRWVPLLAASDTAASLQALSSRLQELLQAADEASREKEKSQQALRQFRLTGGRHSFIDEVNKLRLSLSGELDQLGASQSLGRDFSRRFFRQTRSTGSSLSLDEEISATSQALEEAKSNSIELEERLKSLLEEKSKQDSEEQEQKQIEEELAAIEKKSAELRARLKKPTS